MWSGRAPQIITEASASKEMADSLTSEEELIYKGGDIPSQENDLKEREREWFKYQRISTGPWEKKMKLMNIFVKMTHFLIVLWKSNIQFCWKPMLKKKKKFNTSFSLQSFWGAHCVNYNLKDIMWEKWHICKV